MAISITRENYFWHKLHSLTGVIPVGYYMVQHLVLNAFSLSGPDKFNGVIDFFDSLPRGLLWAMEVGMIWTPLLFHAVYGLFIVDRAKLNYLNSPYKWSQNRMYTAQRFTGVFLFVFLMYHTIENTGMKYLKHDSSIIKFDAWHAQLTGSHYLWLLFYMAGVFTASYHLCYGLWSFCIRWGLTISEAAQMRIQRFSFVAFLLLTLIGWGALAGFVIPRNADDQPVQALQLGKSRTAMKRIYEFTPNSSRLVFDSDRTKIVEWIEVPERGLEAVEDGPQLPDGTFSGGTLYQSGGIIEFADGSSERYPQIGFQYQGDKRFVSTDFAGNSR